MSKLREEITEDKLIEIGWVRAGFTCFQNEFGVINDKGQLLKRILSKDGKFIFIDSNKEIESLTELLKIYNENNEKQTLNK